MSITKSSPRRLILFSMAALTIAAASGIFFYRHFIRKEQPRGLTALVKAVGARRFIEARLTGGFAYGPYQPAKLNQPVVLGELQPSSSEDQKRNTRGGEQSTERAFEYESPWMAQAAADILQEAVENPSAQALGKKGMLRLFQNDFDQAVKDLEKAVEESPKDAKLLNDLAAAYLTRAQACNKPHDIVRALSSIHDAVEIDPTLPEIRFNKALILERIFLLRPARQEWEEYLKMEASSDWQAEARAHIASLDAPPPFAAWAQDKIKLADAARRDDAIAVKEIVKRFPHPARLYAIDELLPAWADAMMEDRKSEAQGALKTAHAIAVALDEIQGEKFVIDQVAFIENVETHSLQTLIDAHRAYRNGQEALDRYEIEKAMTEFKTASDAFAQIKDKAGEILSLTQIAYCHYGRVEFDKALSLIDLIRPDLTDRNYLYLNSRRWMTVGLIHLYSSEPTQAISAFEQAISYFEKTGDIDNAAKATMNISGTLNQIGENQDIWHYLYKAVLMATKIEQPTNQLKVLIGASNIISSKGEPKAAIYFFSESISFASNNGSLKDAAIFIFTASLQRSRLYYESGNKAAALTDLNNAEAFLSKVSDSAIRDNAQKELLLLKTEYGLKDDPKSSIESLTEIIKTYEPTSFRYKTAYTYLLRARAYMALDDYSNAESDLEASIRESEKERNNILQEDHRSIFFERPQVVYEEMAKLQAIRRNRPDQAFDYVEKARARTLLDLMDQKQAVRLSPQQRILINRAATPLTLSEISKLLPEETALVEYCLLDDQLFVWIIKKDNFQFIRQPIESSKIERSIDMLSTAIENSYGQEKLSDLLKSLYNAILQPFAASLPSNVVIVPNKKLAAVPFAALINPNTGRYFIEDYTVSISPSATAFIKAMQKDRKLGDSHEISVLAVGNPSFAHNAFPNLPDLPSAEMEAKAVAALYKTHKLLIGADATKQAFLNEVGKYNIIHLAGHAIQNTDSPYYSRLILAPEKDGDGVLYAYELYNLRFVNTRLVVLAACRTASGKYISGEGVSNLARPFLASGIPAVIASLWNTDDRASAKLFSIFHKRLAAGDNGADALRKAQLALLKSSDPGLTSPAMWAPFVLFGINSSAVTRSASR